jgi:glycosyltransferase involved in cell wall biosynthesis
VPVDLSLVLACYNSAIFLEGTVSAIRRELSRSALTYELIFVDDASRDATVEVIQRIIDGQTDCQFLRHERNTGRGRAVGDGMRLAHGRVVGFVDVDLATPAHYIPILTRAVLDGADLACGLRTYVLSPSTIHRWILSRGYNRLVRWGLGQSFQDSEAGCKFFCREIVRCLIEETENEGWFWDTEVMVRAALHDYRIVELPTVFIQRPGLGSTVRLVHDTVDYAVNLWRFRRTVARLRAEKEARKMRATASDSALP